MFQKYIFGYLCLCLALAWSPARGAQQTVNVSVEWFHQLAYFPQGSLPAVAVSLNDTALAAQIESSVTDIPVMVADTVRRGDVLVKLDCRNSMAMQRSHQAKLSLAEYLLQSAEQLSADNHVSKELLHTRQSEVHIARETLAISSLNVQRCQVLAPFTGVLTQRLADIGEWVNKGDPLLRLVDMENIEVSAQLPDLLFNEIKNVSQFAFVTDHDRFALRLRKIGDVVDETARTREVRLQFIERRADPGQSGRLTWKKQQRYLPSGFLAKRGGQYGVFVVDNKRAKFVPAPDAQEGRPVRIELADDTLVIVNGRHSVKQGDPLHILQAGQ